MKNISSQPGAGIYRTSIVIIVVLICITVFFTVTENISTQAEQVSRDRVLTDLKYSLSMTLYDYAVKGKQSELRKFHEENPFVLLAIYRALPSNYYGTVKEVSRSEPSGWYFDLNEKVALYINLKGDISSYRLVFVDGQNRIGRLEIVPNKGSK